MTPITPEWRIVLTNHINQKYKRTFQPAELKFEHNPYYTPTSGTRIIDVLPGDDSYFGKGIMFIEPYDPAKYFTSLPITLYPDDDITGSELVDLLGNIFGVVFDKDIDFDPDFLVKVFRQDQIGVVTIPFSNKSFIWEGTLDVIVGASGLNLPTAVKHRNLEALMLPDVVVDGSQSLWLLTTPIVLADKVLIRQFSASEPIIVTGDTLDLLMTEIKLNRIVDDKHLPELRQLLNGVEFVNGSTGDTDIDRYRTSSTPISGATFSGNPVFRFKSVDIDNDVSSVVGELNIKDLPDVDLINVQVLVVGAGDVSARFLPTLLAAQAKLYPERKEGIDALIAAMSDTTVFSTMTRAVGANDIPNGKATIYAETVKGGTYTGRLAITFPLPDFVIEDELQRPVITEDGVGPLELEGKYIIVNTDTGEFSDGGAAMMKTTIPEVSLVALMIYEPDQDKVIKVKSDVTATPYKEGNVYTQPDWAGVEIMARKNTI